MIRSLALGLALIVAVQSPHDEAARLSAAGDLAAADSIYRRLLAETPDDPELHYNLGTVLALQRRYDEARPHLETAAGVDAPTLVVAAPYNLGNTDLEPAYADSALAERDERLRRSIESYKAALRAAPSDEDAKWNLELARRLLERDPPPSGGGGGGGGGEGNPQPGERQPTPSTGGGPGSSPQMSEDQIEELLNSARQRETEVQRDRLKKPQPPGPIEP